MVSVSYLPQPLALSHNPPINLSNSMLKPVRLFVPTALNGEVTVINRVDILLLSSKFTQSKPCVLAAKAAVS